jgi:hypothetical protein
MTDLELRIRRGLGNEWNAAVSPWEGLMRLYESDREAFYLLACDGIKDGDEVTRPLADLAQRVRATVRSTYSVEQQDGSEEAAIRPLSGEPLPVPRSLLARVKSFLLEIDGKGTSDRAGKDYEGRPASEAEVRFKLGEPTAFDREQARILARREAKPVVLRLTPADFRSLAHQPGYVTHGLFHCARKTVLAPTAVYRGLKRGDKEPPRLANGWAICGKPNRAYDNDGRKVQPPADMLYMVYADADGFVFDWDWVAEDPHHPGHPLDNDLRFGELVPEPGEFVLDLPDGFPASAFDSSFVAYSARGDCVFCYVLDSPSFGARINEDLTVFYSLDDRDQITGFKIKNVRRILQEEQARNLSDAPGLNVLILPILRRTLPQHQEVTIKLYEIIIAVLVDVKIPVAEQAADDSDLLATTC